ncbi:hypothetical protein GCM10009804_47380 [Kribbella hippodromi]|uniref:Secreted protein n=1 Tax=Kribbella hippodromi TaxID=434347 RepID=A0ABN2DT08_9ACTN
MLPCLVLHAPVLPCLVLPAPVLPAWCCPGLMLPRPDVARPDAVLPRAASPVLARACWPGVLPASASAEWVGGVAGGDVAGCVVIVCLGAGASGWLGGAGWGC